MTEISEALTSYLVDIIKQDKLYLFEAVNKKTGQPATFIGTVESDNSDDATILAILVEPSNNLIDDFEFINDDKDFTFSFSESFWGKIKRWLHLS